MLVLQGERDKKQQQLDDLRKQREVLDNMDNQLNAIIKVSKSLQELTGYNGRDDVQGGGTIADMTPGAGGQQQSS